MTITSLLSQENTLIASLGLRENSGHVLVQFNDVSQSLSVELAMVEDGAYATRVSRAIRTSLVSLEINTSVAIVSLYFCRDFAIQGDGNLCKTSAHCSKIVNSKGSVRRAYLSSVFGPHEPVPGRHKHQYLFPHSIIPPRLTQPMVISVKPEYDILLFLLLKFEGMLRLVDTLDIVVTGHEVEQVPVARVDRL